MNFLVFFFNRLLVTFLFFLLEMEKAVEERRKWAKGGRGIGFNVTCENYLEYKRLERTGGPVENVNYL